MEEYWKTQLNNITDLHNFTGFIKEFFSQNGEAVRINVMYNKLHNEDNAVKPIKRADLQITRSLYNEYEVGFIRHLKTHASDPNIIGITDVANEKFLHEIFDGKYNKPEDTTLCYAVGNLEVLVDLIPDIESMIRNQNMISNKDCYVSYTKFTVTYLKKMINEIIDTYEEIINKLEGHKNPKGQYKLFM